MPHHPNSTKQELFIQQHLRTPTSLAQIICSICAQHYSQLHAAVQIADVNNSQCVFGRTCIKQWLRSDSAASNICPSCQTISFNSHADIEVIKISSDDDDDSPSQSHTRGRPTPQLRARRAVAPSPSPSRTSMSFAEAEEKDVRPSARTRGSHARDASYLRRPQLHLHAHFPLHHQPSASWKTSPPISEPAHGTWSQKRGQTHHHTTALHKHG